MPVIDSSRLARAEARLWPHAVCQCSKCKRLRAAEVMLRAMIGATALGYNAGRDELEDLLRVLRGDEPCP